MATWPRADVGDSRYEPTGRRAVAKMKACPQWSDADDWTYLIASRALLGCRSPTDSYAAEER